MTASAAHMFEPLREETSLYTFTYLFFSCEIQDASKVLPFQQRELPCEDGDSAQEC